MKEGLGHASAPKAFGSRPRRVVVANEALGTLPIHHTPCVYNVKRAEEDRQGTEAPCQNIGG